MFLPTRLRSPSEDLDAALVNFFTIAVDDDDRRSECDRDGDGDGVSGGSSAGGGGIALSQDAASAVGKVPEEETEEDVLVMAKAGDDLCRSKTPNDVEP